MRPADPTKPCKLMMVPRDSSFNTDMSIVCDKTKLLVFSEVITIYETVNICPMLLRSYKKNREPISMSPFVNRIMVVSLKNLEMYPKIKAKTKLSTFAVRNI